MTRLPRVTSVQLVRALKRAAKLVVESGSRAMNASEHSVHAWRVWDVPK